jgi:hypothetical protein
MPFVWAVIERAAASLRAITNGPEYGRRHKISRGCRWWSNGLIIRWSTGLGSCSEAHDFRAETGQLLAESDLAYGSFVMDSIDVTIAGAGDQ